MGLADVLGGGGGNLLSVKPREFRRLQLAQGIQNQDFSSVRSPLEGFAKMLTSALGGHIADQEYEKMDVRQKAAQDNLASALSMGTGASAGLDPTTGISWDQGRAPNKAAMQSMLLQNPDTQQIGQKMVLDNMSEEEQAARQEKQARLAHALSIDSIDHQYALGSEERDLRRQQVQLAIDNAKQAAVDRLESKEASKATKEKISAVLSDPNISNDPTALAKALAIADPKEFADDLLKTTAPTALPKGVKLPEGMVPVRDAAAPGGFRAEPMSGVPKANAGEVGISKPTEGSEKDRRLGKEGLSRLNDIEKILFTDGKFNRSAILQGTVGKGRSVDQAMTAAIQNALYLKTGQSAPDAEVEKNKLIYMPSALDNDEQASAKFNSLKTFLNDSIPAYARGATDMKSKYGLQ